MPIKIVRQGKDPRLDTMAGTCSNCKTGVECLRHECNSTSDQRDGDWYSVVCPVCKRDITMTKKVE